MSRKPVKRSDLAGHHPEVVEVISMSMDKEASDQDTMLVAIGAALAEKRERARRARQGSGIEEIWARCEDHYANTDDMNRLDQQVGRWSKPMDSSGPVTTNRQPSQADARSKIFVGLTRRYVDAAYAKLSEILLPPDDKAFSMSETPVPDLIQARGDRTQVMSDQGVPLTRPLAQGETPPQQPAEAVGSSPPAAVPAGAAPAISGVTQPTQTGAAAPGPLQPGVTSGQGASPPMTPRVPLTVGDLAEESIQIARAKAKKAEIRIYDWMVEGHYRAESRKAMFNAARLGVGVLKGPVPKLVRGMVKTRRPDGSFRITMEERIIPFSKSVSPWDYWPDPSCGDDPKEGDWDLERDWLSERQLLELRGAPDYIVKNIERVVVEGPDYTKLKARENGTLNNSTEDSTKYRYEVFYYTGFLSDKEVDCACSAAGSKFSRRGAAEGDKVPQYIPVIATFINETVIKVVPAPLQSGRRPYDVFPWQKRNNHWAGVGVAEQLFASQKMLNGAVRAMMNNAGKSAGTQIVVDQASIRPADGNWIIYPDKVWYRTGEAGTSPIADSFQVFKIPNITNELMGIVQLAYQMAEEDTQIPLISQGQSGQAIPATLGGMQIQNSNAEQLLRAIGYSWDDHITEPKVEQYYEWLLLDPEVPDDEKGDFQIDAHGSVVMVERAIQDQTILQMGPLVPNPVFGIDPKRWSTQLIKSRHLNPADFKYSPEEQARLDAQPPPEDPRVTAAKVTMQGWVAEAQVKGQADAQKTQVQATVDLHELQMKREMALLDYANQHKINLAQVQAELAATAIKVQAQERMNAANNALDESVGVTDRAHEAISDHVQRAHDAAEADRQRRHDMQKHRMTLQAKPPVQVPGRAGNGKAYSQSRGRN